MSEPTAALPLPPPPPPPPPPAGASSTRATVVGQTALAMVGLGGALVALRAIDVHGPPCPFRTLTGIACPGCGMTRLAAAVTSGDLPTALGNDPAGVAFLVVLAAIAVVHLVRVVVRRGPPPDWLGRRAVGWALAGLLGLHWVTTLAWGGMLDT